MCTWKTVCVESLFHFTVSLTSIPRRKSRKLKKKRNQGLNEGPNVCGSKGQGKCFQAQYVANGNAHTHTNSATNTIGATYQCCKLVPMIWYIVPNEAAQHLGCSTSCATLSSCGASRRRWRFHPSETRMAVSSVIYLIVNNPLSLSLSLSLSHSSHSRWTFAAARMPPDEHT